MSKEIDIISIVCKWCESSISLHRLGGQQQYTFVGICQCSIEWILDCEDSMNEENFFDD